VTMASVERSRHPAHPNVAGPRQLHRLAGRIALHT
jgi:hypothetical protein